MKKIKRLLYLGWWFFGARVLGRKRPLQTVLFISNRCNLRCRHCSVYSRATPDEMTFEEIRRELEYSYRLGSRFVDLEGGEVMIWRDGRQADRRRDRPGPRGGFLLRDDHHQRPVALRREPCRQHLGQPRRLWEVPRNDRGEGTFARLERNIAACGHPHLSVNRMVNKYNWEHVAETIEYVKRNPAIESISINFYTPFPDADDLMITREQREPGDRHRDPDEARGLSGDELRFGAGADAAQPLQAPLLGHELHLCRPYARQLLGRAAGHLRRLRALHGGRDERRVQLPADTIRAGLKLRL